MISCSEYDVIEMVCLYRYPLRLTMKNGDVIDGVALDTGTNAQREECIKLTTAVQSSDLPRYVVLEDIAVLTVTVANPHVNKLTFS